jgi:hypothetical protein
MERRDRGRTTPCSSSVINNERIDRGDRVQARHADDHDHDHGSQAVDRGHGRVPVGRLAGNHDVGFDAEDRRSRCRIRQPVGRLVGSGPDPPGTNPEEEEHDDDAGQAQPDS